MHEMWRADVKGGVGRCGALGCGGRFNMWFESCQLGGPTCPGILQGGTHMAQTRGGFGRPRMVPAVCFFSWGQSAVD